MHGGREAGDRGDEHHALRAEIDDARSLVDDQTQGDQREDRARIEGGREKQRKGFHVASTAQLGVGGSLATHFAALRDLG